MKANFSAETAKHYLDAKAEEFGAQRQEHEDQGTVYYFITASTLGSILDDSEPPSQPQEDLERRIKNAAVDLESFQSGFSPADHEQSVPQALIQSELAKRLDVHSSTVYKRRDDLDFAEWSRSRDPEGIAWAYSADTKHFSPLEVEPVEE